MSRKALYKCSSLDTTPNLAPPTTFEVGKFGLALLHWGEIMSGPMKLSRRALYDDGQMINSNVINHVINTQVEFVFNKHGCRWRADMYRFESISILTVHAFWNRNRETRLRHLSIEKMFLPSFLRDPVKVEFISWLCHILRCYDWVYVTD